MNGFKLIGVYSDEQVRAFMETISQELEVAVYHVRLNSGEDVLFLEGDYEQEGSQD